jgi:hypothetical protein
VTGAALERPRLGALRRRLRPLEAAVLIAAASGVVAYTLVEAKPALALGLVLLPLVAWESSRLTAALVLLGASLPAFYNIAGGSLSVNIAVSDVLLAFIGAAILMRIVVTRSAPALLALRPIALPVVQYGVVMLFLLAVHPGFREPIQTGQRFELLILPLLVGAHAALTNRYVQLLAAYVLAATVLAAVWPFTHLTLQKNPVGQVIGNAILLLVAFRPLRRFAPCLFVLVPGLVLSGSRGAVGATAIGIAILALMHESRGRTFLTRVVPVAVVAVAVFALAPASLQNRLTTFSSGGPTAAFQTREQWAIFIREQYTRDAHRIIAAHPWTGIGIGNYFASSATDPHQVLLLHAAEGGYGFAVSFVLLVGGTCLVLFRRMRRIEITPVAAAVLLATVAHGLVDVYWVRGTPVLGWLLVGMACGVYARNRAAGNEA